MSYLQQLHEEHKKRLARFEVAAALKDYKIGSPPIETSAQPDNEPITIRRIIELVARKSGISYGFIVSTDRRHGVLVPRQIAMALACKFTRFTLIVIGQHFGGKDHSTIWHAREKYSPLLAEIKLPADAPISQWVDAALDAARPPKKKI